MNKTVVEYFVGAYDDLGDHYYLAQSHKDEYVWRRVVAYADVYLSESEANAACVRVHENGAYKIEGFGGRLVESEHSKTLLEAHLLGESTVNQWTTYVGHRNISTEVPSCS